MNLRIFNKKSKNQENSRESKSSFFRELITFGFLAVFVVLPIRVFVFQPFFVSGQSMEPNFHDGEYLIVNEFGYKSKVMAGNKEVMSLKRFNDFERGDVVVFRYPLNPNEFFIKRIVGLPGEKVKVTDGKVKIYNEEFPSGFTLEESAYLPDSALTRGEEDFELGENEFIVLGDNRLHSSDSRSWGKLDGDYIVGKVLLRGWPLSEARFF
ncbi:MAG TPA: signal peptidase I [Candidatus Moranbacteria bacterium]|nr:signal peptidase I [Candidatus Moranbacteria bacterium]